MKKGVSIFLSVAMMATLLAGCSKSATASSSANDSSSQAPVTINFTYWESNAADKSAWATTFSKFQEENPNIKINAQVVPSGDKYYTALSTRVAANDYPDVARMTYQKAGKYIRGGVLKDLTQEIDSSTQKDLLPAYKAPFTYNNKLYGIPHLSDTVVLFYNKAMFEKAGITNVPTSAKDAWTWDQFLDVAKKVKTANNLQYAFSYAWTKNCAYRALPLLYMNSGSVLDSSGKKAAVDNTKGVEWLNFIQSWVSGGLFSKTSPNATDDPNDLFCNGIVGMIFSGTYNISYFDTNMKASYGATFMPQVSGKTGSDLGGTGFISFNKSAHPKEAAKLMNFLLRSDNMAAFCAARAELPVRTSLIKSGVNYSSHQDLMKMFAAQAATIDPKMAAAEANPQFDVMESAMANNIEKIILNGESGSQAAKGMASDINSALSDED